MNAYLLWENDEFTISTPQNPHIPYSEGQHVIVSPKKAMPNAWSNTGLAERTFGLASRVCKIMEKLEFAPWFNIQANGNWGLLPGATPFFHVHIYSRQKTESWGKPVVLPEAPGTFQNSPMPETDREKISNALTQQLE